MSRIEDTINPFSIAIDEATRALDWYDLPAPHPNDRPLNIEMTKLAADLQLLDKPYQVNASRAVGTFAEQVNGVPTVYYDYLDITLGGILICYQRTFIARRGGGIGINAFCAGFKNVCLYPEKKQLPKSLIVAVPIFAARHSKSLD